MSESNKRGTAECRACSSSQLFSGLDLGSLPIANELFLQPSEFELFPLHLKVCRICGLGQVGEVVSASRLFSDYRYLSSISSTFINHARTYAKEILSQNDWRESDWVLEIASNDGYLLRNFVERGRRVLGIEPASNIARVAIQEGIPTINEFFSSNLAQRILKEYGHPRLIVANNVFAHVPDIQDFTYGLSILMSERTQVSIENPSIINLIKSLQFDSIYHEHYSYLSANAVSKLMNKNGLSISKIEHINTHGGSNRYWISKNLQVDCESVANAIKLELNEGLLNEHRWQTFSKEVNRVITEFRYFVEEKNSLGQVVVGYGAAAKASTLLNASGVSAGSIPYIIDESPEKVGRFMPSRMIPIVDSSHLLRSKPDHVVIFPWNISSEIAKKIRMLCNSSKIQIWRAIPRLEEVA